MSAKIYRIKLSEDERRELENIRDRGSLKTKTFKKATALLSCEEGRLGPALADEAICRVVVMGPSSVLRLRQRCCETGSLGALKPWRQEGWCIPPKQNASFVAPMEDVLQVYHRPLGRQLPAGLS